MGVPENRLPAQHHSAQVPVPSFTFSEIERMAKSMANSGLFGAKTPDEALTVLMIAQAEGIHPMTAAMTYHIMDMGGRKSITMKSNIMAARFQAAGGTIEWEEGTPNEKRACATFRHPSSPKPVRIEWTFAMAEEIGLTKRNPNWKTYPRAQLRSRVESEGVRTCLPMVIMGKYTPEESYSMDDEIPTTKEEKIASFERPGLLQSLVDEWLQQIKECTSEKDLREVFKGAMAEARGKQDGPAIGTFTLAYDAQLELIREAAKTMKPEAEQHHIDASGFPAAQELAKS